MSEPVTQVKFFEEIQKLRDEIHKVTNTMTKTTTLIRDYNGLRETINDMDDTCVMSVLYIAIALKEGFNANTALMGFIYGLLSAAVAVYGDQVIKQIKKK